MKSFVDYARAAVIGFSIFILACSSGDEEQKKGAIEQMTDRAAEVAVEKIRSPIEKAKEVRKLEEGRAAEADKALEEE